MRGDSVRYAQAKGLSREERKALGRWEQGSMDQCYARSLPIDAMRTMAGFHPVHHNYRIRRDLKVPELLLRKVFPGIDRIMAEEEAKSSMEKNFAKIQFLQVLKYMRKLIVQDSCLLRDIHPNHEVWHHEVFRCSEYEEFCERVKMATAAHTESEQEMTMEERLPPIMEGFELKLKNACDAIQEVRAESHYYWRNILEVLSSGSVELRFGSSSNLSQPRAPKTTGDHEAEAAASSCTDVGASRYTMNRSVKSVTRLWQEWFMGINGQPSIKSLEEKGSEWRKEEKERVYFSKRRNIIRLVQEFSQTQRLSKEDVIGMIDEIIETKKKSLNWIGTHTKEVRENLMNARQPGEVRGRSQGTANEAPGRSSCASVTTTLERGIRQVPLNRAAVPCSAARTLEVEV